MNGKGSYQRPRFVKDETFHKNWDAIFVKDESLSKKNYKFKQQDLTELNGDGNRDRGRYGEDNR